MVVVVMGVRPYSSVLLRLDAERRHPPEKINTAPQL